MSAEKNISPEVGAFCPLSFSCSLVSFVLLLAGCGGGLPASVGGTVMLDGKPLTTGNVTFQSQESGITAYGQIQSSGRYTLQTGTDKGLPAGEYTVTVVATEPLPAVTDPKVAPAPPKLITPAKYNNPASSGLKFTVKTGSNDIDLSLNSNGP